MLPATTQQGPFLSSPGEKPEPGRTYPLLEQCPADGDPLLKLLDLPFMLGLGVNLDFALIGVQQFQLLLQLHPQDLVLGLLRLVQPQLGGGGGKERHQGGAKSQG